VHVHASPPRVSRLMMTGIRPSSSSWATSPAVLPLRSGTCIVRPKANSTCSASVSCPASSRISAGGPACFVPSGVKFRGRGQNSSPVFHSTAGVNGQPGMPGNVTGRRIFDHHFWASANVGSRAGLPTRSSRFGDVVRDDLLRAIGLPFNQRRYCLGAWNTLVITS